MVRSLRLSGNSSCAFLAALIGLLVPVNPVQSSSAIFVPVLLYHHVKVPKASDNAIERGLTVLPAQMNAQLEYLSNRHFHTVTAARLTEALLGTSTLPSKPVVLTFDDGYSDVYLNAFRILRQHHMRATFFIVPYLLGQPRYLSWSQVQDMSSHGMDIEAHTLTHPDLSVLSWRQLWKEVVGSRQALENRLHRSVRVFAYPYGAYNAVVIRAVARAGFHSAFTTRHGWFANRANILTLPRVHVTQQNSLTSFVQIVHGQ
ncbi:MAG: hypothetical protein NVSMB52_09620 [Chloroflexota bacterium]